MRLTPPLATLLAITALLAACGTKGPLTLPPGPAKPPLLGFPPKPEKPVGTPEVEQPAAAAPDNSSAEAKP